MAERIAIPTDGVVSEGLPEQHLAFVTAQVNTALQRHEVERAEALFDEAIFLFQTIVPPKE